MRLFLSSYRAGKHNKELVKFLDGIKKVAVITNAKDYKHPKERKIKVNEVLDFFRLIDIEPTEIDLRPFFRKPGAEELLADFEFIWLAGGNVFLLRRALAYTGLDKFIISKVRASKIIYGGESAGAIIAGPTLRESEMEGDEDSPDFIVKGYFKEVLWDGLKLVDFVPVPHFQDIDYGAEIEKYIKRLEDGSIPYKEITNDQSVVVNGSKVRLLK